MNPYVRLLGRIRVRVGDDVWEPPSHLPVALLAYVAHQGDWVDRGALAALFWPESDQSSALTNLRSLLARSKREEYAAGFEVESSRVRWDVACDAAEFRRALDAGRWAKAVETFGGPFLGSMAFDASPAFDGWLRWTREDFKDAYQTAALRLAESSKDAGDLEGAITAARDLLQEDPLNEAATQVLMDLYATAGRSDAAIRVYRGFAERLEAELDLAPSAATTGLLREIEAVGDSSDDALREDAPDPAAGTGVAAAPPTPGPARRSNPRREQAGPGERTAGHRTAGGSLPAALTPFFGREDEIAAIVDHLGEHGGRLVTLTGPGGVGKTRLAAVAAERMRETYEDGVAFASLESVASAADVPAAIATALDLDLRSRELPEAQLVRGIGERHLLLVLDNFEHVLPATDLVPALLKACPRLHILVTSRERLGFPFERLVDMRGLPYPAGTPTVVEADRFAAVTCLYARMRQVRPTLPMDEATLGPVAEICRLVEGLPLALELAAVWVRSMPLDQIAHEIRRNLDFLSFGPAASSSRHRSVRAAFEHSWKLLTSQERDAMRKLSVFRGGFRRSAAAFVADASIAVLAALVDKSLLRVSLEGRYDWHPLIAAFAHEKLAGDPKVELEARRRHAEYLVWLLEQAQPHYATKRRHIWQRRLEAERENLSAALLFAREDEDLSLGSQLILMLRWMYWPWGFLAARRTLVEELVALPGPVRPELRAAALHIAGVVTHGEGDVPKAAAFYEEAIALANPETQSDILVRLHSNLAYIERDRGQFDAARDLLERARDLREWTGDTPSAANMLNNFASLERQQGNLEAARRWHQEALDIGRGFGDPLTICQALNGLAYVERALGREDEAEALFQETLEHARAHQIGSSIIASLDALGRIERRRGALQNALDLHSQALEALHATRTFRLLDRTLDGSADLLAAAGRPSDAARIWGAGDEARRTRGAREPQDPPPDRKDLQVAAREALGEHAFERAAAVGAALDREAAIEAALEALERI